MNQYIYNNYTSGSSSSSSSSQQYSPPISNGMMNNNTSPIFNYDHLGSSVSTISSVNSNYSINNPRLRYYVSKSFDLEDDLEFCPEIPDHLQQQQKYQPATTSPMNRKFNAYTASVFSPTSNNNSLNNTTIKETDEIDSPITNASQSPRVSTPRVRKPIEIINPQTKMRISSPIVPK